MSSMTSRTTRGSAAREAAFLANSEKERLPQQQLSSPPVTPPPNIKSRPAKRTSKAKATPGKIDDNPALTPKTTSSKKGKTPATKTASTPKAKNQGAGSETPATSRKRKRAAPLKVEQDINELPHNLGRAPPTFRGKVDIKDEVKDEGDEDAQSPAKKKASSRTSSPPALKRQSLPADKVLGTELADADAPAD
ncbi:MAG: hypothetical protein M1835_003340, partial [Candelina submexicana]